MHKAKEQATFCIFFYLSQSQYLIRVCVLIIHRRRKEFHFGGAKLVRVASLGGSGGMPPGIFGILDTLRSFCVISAVLLHNHLYTAALEYKSSSTSGP